MKPIRLILTEAAEELPVESSHFWGSPSLPEGMAYPTYTDKNGEEYPYTFICQLNMADVAPYDIDNLLPHEGLMLFFANIDHYLGDYETETGIGGVISGPEEVRIIYLPNPVALREIVLVDDNGAELSPAPMKVKFSLNIPDICDETMLLAPPSHREWENWDHPFEDRLILLQVDSFEGSDFSLNFMDCGVLCFLISPDALREHDFSDVRAIVLST